jgi:glucan phosphorylase
MKSADFYAEYGLSNGLSIYPGGLDTGLRGYQLKSASSLNLPLVAVGPTYRQSYFIQKQKASSRKSTTPTTSTTGLCPWLKTSRTTSTSSR